MRKKQYHHGDLKNALIRAGIHILATEGMGGLTLRKAAQRAGVSHSAPYAHFPDKESLVAAISAEGIRELWDRIAEATERYQDDPVRRLAETAWQTVRFGLDHPDHYRITFSKVIENEAQFPAYLELAHSRFAKLVELVRDCQAAGALEQGPAEQVAVELWSLVHGLILLLLNRQIPRAVLTRTSPRALLSHALASRLGLRALPALSLPRPRRAAGAAATPKTRRSKGSHAG
jgi:AcrR family transcriptional regulator